MGKLVDEAKAKEAAEKKGLLKKVAVIYIGGKFDGQEDLVSNIRADALVKRGKAKKA